MEYTIDSIENKVARMIDEEEDVIEIDAKLLPIGAQEGSSVKLVEGEYVLVDDSKNVERIQSKFDHLFDY